MAVQEHDGIMESATIRHIDPAIEPGKTAFLYAKGGFKTTFQSTSKYCWEPEDRDLSEGSGIWKELGKTKDVGLFIAYERMVM